MSKVSVVSKLVEFVADNSTTLLTVGAISGVVATGVTSWYAAKKTEKIKVDLGEDASKSEVFKEAWPYYVAPVVLGILTIASVAMLNIEHDKKYAALLGAYTIAKADKEKLNKKVKELVGEEKANQIKESLGIKEEASDIEDYKMINGSNVISGDPYKKEWIVDAETGVRIFTSKVAVVSAADMLNRMLVESPDEGQTIADFYDYLGLGEDDIPDIAQQMCFGIGKRVPSMRLDWGSKTDKELYTIPCFTYDFNLDVNEYEMNTVYRRDW